MDATGPYKTGLHAERLATAVQRKLAQGIFSGICVSKGVFIAACALIIPLQSATAQDKVNCSPICWQWKVFNTQNSDLPDDRVSALAMSADGTLWVGTAGGLARLQDGQWQVFTVANSDLPDDRVLALAGGPDGALWVGTEGGLGRLQDGRLQAVFTAASGELPDDRVMALAGGPDGALWVGTEGGLGWLQDGQLHAVFTAASGELPDDRVSALALGSDGALWAGTAGGLAHLEDGHWQHFTTANSDLPHGSVTALALGSDGALWVGTEDWLRRGGLARLEDGQWQVFTAANSDLPGDSANALAFDAHGALWVGAQSLFKGRGGLAQLDNDGQWQVFTAANSDLPSSSVHALTVGPDGAVWMGTQDGLARLDDGQWQVFTAANSDLPDDAVTALALGADGTLWVGTNGGLARLEDERWEIFTAANSDLPHNRVQALAVGAGGTLWVGTAEDLDLSSALRGARPSLGGGLARLEDGQWQVFTAANSGLPRGSVNALALGPHGTLWVGTGTGLARLDERRGQVFTAANSDLPADGVRALALGADGILWAGTLDVFARGSGLARLKDGEWQIFTAANSDLPHNRVTALAFGADGVLWVGTAAAFEPGGGLARLEDGQWQVFTATNSGLPGDRVWALAPAAGGGLWIATDSGLARLEDGDWQLFTAANSDLQVDGVGALAADADGTVWVETGGSLARLDSRARPRIIDLIGRVSDEAQGRITQSPHTFAVLAFDPTYRTEVHEVRYAWMLDGKEEVGRSPYYTAWLDKDGWYTVSVQAIDKYGFRSEPYPYKFEFKRPKEDPVEILAQRLGLWGSAAACVYFLALFPLIWLYPHFGWARSAVNSRVFTRFPVLHKVVLNSRWARARVFLQYAEIVRAGAKVPAHYIVQSMFREGASAAAPLAIGSASLAALFEPSPRVLVLARSGTGKSVLLRFMLREMAGRFLNGADRRLPVLIDMRTSPIAGRNVEALIRDALRGGGEKALQGGGMELPDAILDHLISKGDLVLLIDSLNELPDRKEAQAFHPFFNQDAANYAIVASQVDLLKRTDFAVYRLAEVTAEQARAYLQEAVGTDVWDQLPPEARALARNPQDLELLAELIIALGPEQTLPTRRAELYREILNHDTALAEWAQAGGASIRAVYGLAMRMAEERLVVGEQQLRDWLWAELIGLDAFSEEAMAEIVGAIGRSRLFREEQEVDVLGKRRPVVGFRHELVGKFLASRHVREVLGAPGDERRERYFELSGEEEWLDVFYFIVDELNAKLTLNAFLNELLDRAQPRRTRVTESGDRRVTPSGEVRVIEGDCRDRIVAYALGTKPKEMITGEVRHRYNLLKLGEDLRRTPAA